VSVDEEGFAVDELEQMLIQYTLPALVFTISAFHNPTGWSTTPARRRRLLEVASAQHRMRAAEILVVEDGSYSLTRFEGEPSPSLFDLSGGKTVFTSSFSTTIAPGLRVGWLIAPEQLSERLERAATDSYITPVLLGQATVYEFLARGAFDGHLERLRTELRLRRDAMASALERYLPDATWSIPQGGFFAWVRLPGHPDGREVVKRAAGVTALTGSHFGAPLDYLRLSYAASDPQAIETGIECIAAAM
jgi:DNA-binding transcriptional MocR family regulator